MRPRAEAVPVSVLNGTAPRVVQKGRPERPADDSQTFNTHRRVTELPTPSDRPQPDGAARSFERPSPSGHDFGRVRVHHGAAPHIQAKLNVSRPGDLYEREADRVAEQVMRMTDDRAFGREGTSRREETLTGQGVGASAAGPQESIVRGFAGGGRPINEPVRGMMEQRFGHDFSRVRVHADASASVAARAVSAQAFTLGHDIVFAAGKYAPATSGGQHLLAHELAHVIQQNGSGPSEEAHAPDARHGVPAAPEAQSNRAQSSADAVSINTHAAPMLMRQCSAPNPSGCTDSQLEVELQTIMTSIQAASRTDPALPALETRFQQLYAELEGRRGATAPASASADLRFRFQQQLLQTEMEIAVRDTPPSDPFERRIWDRYNDMFTDAHDFAWQLAGHVDTYTTTAFDIPDPSGGMLSTTFPRGAAADVRRLLRGGRSPHRLNRRAREARAEAARVPDIFSAFTGRWAGRFQAVGGRPERYEHDWRPSAPVRSGSTTLTQIALFAQAGQTEPMGYQHGGQATNYWLAINAVSRDTGTIIGAVGVRPSGISDRPHIGFNVTPGTLIWIALEGISGTTRTYSFFYEVMDQTARLFTIRGIRFTWDGRTLTVIGTMGGQYRL